MGSKTITSFVLNPIPVLLRTIWQVEGSENDAWLAWVVVSNLEPFFHFHEPK